uniref:Uncharacterized protein n=1 Tax=Meloidogyne javanica TaxID=6303 RepID=A0A915LNB9_MELJA
MNGLKSRMAEKLDSIGKVKRSAWADNRDLIIATVLDPRFKLVYLEANRIEEYKVWLIAEAEKLVQLEARRSGESVQQAQLEESIND